MLRRFTDTIVYVYHKAGRDIGLISDGWNELLGLSRSSWVGIVSIKRRAMAGLDSIEMRIFVLRVSWSMRSHTSTQVIGLHEVGIWVATFERHMQGSPLHSLGMKCLVVEFYHCRLHAARSH
jgi:hypothetical protein